MHREPKLKLLIRKLNSNRLSLYTCQLSRLGCKSHACEAKTSISRSLAYRPISHALLESMSSCSHIWQTPWKYVICKRVICTQNNNGLKSAHKWQFFHGRLSDFWKRRGCAWQNDILGPSSEDDPRIFRNIQIVFVNFWKVFGHFQIWVQWFHNILMKISRLCVRKSWKVYHWKVPLSFIVLRLVSLKPHRT